MRSNVPPVIRQRGERYADQGRVRLDAVTLMQVRATVAGSAVYRVVMTDDLASGRVKVSCTCAFFAKGYACKHLWAAAVKADRVLKRQTGRAGAGLGQQAAVEEKGAAIPPRPGWRGLFGSGAWLPSASAPPWAKGLGEYQLRYEVQIHGAKVRISAVERYCRKDGKPGRRRAVQAATVEHSGLPRADRAVLAVLLEVNRRGKRYAYSPSFSRDLSAVEPESHDLEVLLPLLAETGRCRLWLGDRCLADPLRLGVPFSAKMELVGEASDGASGEGVTLAPVARIEGREGVGLNTIDIFFRTRPVSFVWQGRLFELKGPSFSWIRSMLAAGQLEVPRKEVPDLIGCLDALPEAPEVRLPEGIGPCPVTDVHPIAVLLVEVEEGRLQAQLFMRYGAIEVPWPDPRQEILDPERWQRIARDLDAEADLVRGLKEHGFAEEGDLFRRAIAGAAEVMSALAAKGWRLEGRDRRPFHGGQLRAMRVSSGLDWFDLDGEVAFGDQIVPLSQAVRAFLRGERLVRLGDGGVGLLPEEWLTRHAAALELAAERAGRGARKELRFVSAHALLLDALLTECEAPSLDERFLELRDALRGFEGVESVPVPEGFCGVLRPYQEEALGWFGFLKRFGFGGVLADDMGLGKTIQALAWLVREKTLGAGPSLVVAPTSLIFNWQAEARRFAPGLKTLVYAGGGRSGLVSEFDDADLVLTTYGLLRRDVEGLREKRFHYVILDESQAIKTAESQTAKAVRLLNATYRLCMTGTPLENHVGELWSQMEFLNPGFLGSSAAFDRRVARPIAAGEPGAAEALKRLVGPFILRRTKEGVASELPKKAEHVVVCQMTKAQARLYEQLRDYYRTAIMTSVERHGMGRSRIKVLEGLLRLRQAASHSALVGDEVAGSGKLQELMARVEETVAAGHKALIFSQFTRLLALIRQSVERLGIVYEYLDGRTPRARREERVRRFQDDESVRLFLISLKAGGVGLNLTAADYVFLVDPWWNPAVEMQAVDRTHRIGQVKDVFTYRLITEGTVEEKVMALQKRKRELVGAILAGSQDLLRHLSRQDLEALFS